MNSEISRRQFLRAAKDGALYTGGIATGLVLASNLVSDKMVEQVKNNIDETKNRERQGQDPKVSDYSLNIYATATQITPFDIDTIHIAGGFFAGVTAGSFFLMPDPETKERAIGAGAALAGRAIDMASTVYFAQVMADPRFKEYGFEAYFKEQSPSIGENPTPEDVIKGSFLPSGFLAAVSAVNPRIGTGYLGMSPFLAMSNYQFGKTIEESLRLGDGVKMVLNDGGTKDDVMDYLKFEVDVALNPQE